MEKQYKQEVIFMPFKNIERMFNDLEDKLNRLGKSGYKVVATEKGTIGEDEHILIILEKEENR